MNTIPLINKNLSDKQIIELFKEYEPTDSYIAVVPPPIPSSFDEGGLIKKTEEAIARERATQNMSPMLVVGFGSMVKGVEIGDRVLVSHHSVPDYMRYHSTHKEQQVRFYLWNYVVTKINNNG
jgi:hypothetical protein